MIYSWVLVFVFSSDAPAVTIQMATADACFRERAKIASVRKAEMRPVLFLECVNQNDRDHQR